MGRTGAEDGPNQPLLAKGVAGQCQVDESKNLRHISKDPLRVLLSFYIPAYRMFQRQPVPPLGDHYERHDAPTVLRPSPGYPRAGLITASDPTA